MKPLTEGMRGMIEYVSPLVDERIVNPGDDFISVLASGEKQGVFTRHQVLVNTSLLLLAGPRDDDQPAVQRHAGVHPASRSMGAAERRPGRRGQAGDRGMPALRFTGQIDPAHRHARMSRCAARC